MEEVGNPFPFRRRKEERVVYPWEKPVEVAPEELKPSPEYCYHQWEPRAGGGWICKKCGLEYPQAWIEKRLLPSYGNTDKLIVNILRDRGIRADETSIFSYDYSDSRYIEVGYDGTFRIYGKPRY